MGGEKKYRRQQAEPEAKVANNVCKCNYLSKPWATQNSQVALNWRKAIVILPPLLLSDPHMPSKGPTSVLTSVFCSPSPESTRLEACRWADPATGPQHPGLHLVHTPSLPTSAITLRALGPASYDPNTPQTSFLLRTPFSKQFPIQKSPMLFHCSEKTIHSHSSTCKAFFPTFCPAPQLASSSLHWLQHIRRHVLPSAVATSHTELLKSVKIKSNLKFGFSMALATF